MAAVSVPYITRMASDLAVIASSIWLTSWPGSPLASVWVMCQVLSRPVFFSHCCSPSQERWSDSGAAICWATTATFKGLASWAKAGVPPRVNCASCEPLSTAGGAGQAHAADEAPPGRVHGILVFHLGSPPWFGVLGCLVLVGRAQAKSAASFTGWSHCGMWPASGMKWTGMALPAWTACVQGMMRSSSPQTRRTRPFQRREIAGDVDLLAPAAHQRCGERPEAAAAEHGRHGVELAGRAPAGAARRGAAGAPGHRAAEA